VGWQANGVRGECVGGGCGGVGFIDGKGCGADLFIDNQYSTETMQQGVKLEANPHSLSRELPPHTHTQ